MVEGPGCKVKGEKMKPKICGQSVSKISGNVITKFVKSKRTCNNSGEDGKILLSPFHVMIGKIITDVQTLGKELFIFFQDFHLCLRVHFLMSGAFRLNGKKIDHEGGGEAETKELVLRLTKDELYFTSSAVCMKVATEALQKIKEFQTLDICFEDFSQKRAVELFWSQGDRFVCDVLLDQLILPGVGNIIKNEALFDSGIKPDSKVTELTHKHVSHLIKMTRDFSMIFYKCRRDGKPLYPYLKIYNKQVCKQCKGKVVCTRMGDDSARMTMFCPKCQDNDLTKFDTKKLAKKNSLLGWVTTVSPTETDEWACAQCTLINTGNRSNCEVCLTPRNKMASTSLSSQISEKQTFTSMNATPDLPDLDIHPSDRLQLKRKLNDQDHYIQSNYKKLCTNQEQNGINDAVANKEIMIYNNSSGISVLKTGSKSLKDSSNTRQNLSMQSSTNSFRQVKTNNSRSTSFQTEKSVDKINEKQVQVQSSLPEPPQCPNHKAKCIMRQVHKKGDNLHRMFWSCVARGRCNFFKWADETFPLCDGHGKRTVLRTVLKQGPNNGKKFYACALSKNKQCGFFKWTDAPIQNPVGPCER